MQAYHRLAPFTPHYLAKNNFTSSAFCLYAYQSQQVSSFPLRASLNKWQVRKQNSLGLCSRANSPGGNCEPLPWRSRSTTTKYSPPLAPDPTAPLPEVGKKPALPQRMRLCVVYSKILFVTLNEQITKHLK